MVKGMLISIVSMAAIAGCASSTAPRASAPKSDPPAAAVPASSQEKEATTLSEPSPPAPLAKTLFDRLGGMPAIASVVSEFTRNVAEDERVNAHFGLADLPILRQHLCDFFCEATGGPCVYKGRTMKAAHQSMGITNAQFDALVGDLVKSMDTLGVPEHEKAEVLGALGPMRKDIVEIE
jgi:hemoglobin